jgi:DNA-binding beta-propeller fold protein YncE
LDYSFEKEAVPPIKKTVIHFIGPWPVVEVYRLSFMVGVETGAQAAGTVETGVESENSVTVGGEYRNQSWSPIIDGRREFRQKPVEWGAEGEASARVYVRPAIEVFLYGVVGPQVDAEPYLDWRGQTNPPMWMWSLNGGADAHLQMKWQKLHERVAFYEKEFTLIDEVEIASGEGRSELGLEEIGSVNFGDGINDVSIIDGGEKAVVPVNAESSVEVVDLSSESVLESLSVQGAARVAIGPDEQFAYIGRGGFGKISRVNLETYEVAEAQGEGAFGGLAVSPDGNEIYASAGGENSAEFRIIDASSLQITNRVPMQESGDLSAGMDIGPGGNAAYVSTGGATRGDFLKIDLSDGGKETLLPEHAGRVAVTPDGNQVWISGSFAGGRVISTETGEILSGDIGSGSDVAISPDGAVAYLASGDKIIAYSTNTFEQIGSLVIQGEARAVAVSQSGEKLCVGTSEGLSIVEVRR